MLALWNYALCGGAMGPQSATARGMRGATTPRDASRVILRPA